MCCTEWNNPPTMPGAARETAAPYIWLRSGNVSQHHRFPRRALARRAVILAASAVVAGSVAAAVWPGHGGTRPEAAPQDVLHRSTAPGGLHLVAFLATRPDTAATASRAQAVTLKSLQTQYGAKGLTTEIIDESGAPADALLNTYYDWQLGDVRLLPDPAGKLARGHAVHNLPTVVLSGANGTVVKRWDSPVLTVQAAQIISGHLTG